MDNESGNKSGGGRSIGSRISDRVNQAGQNIGQRAGDRADSAIQRGRQAAKEGINAAKNVAGYAGRVGLGGAGAGGAGRAAGQAGKAGQAAGAGGRPGAAGNKSPLQKGLNAHENTSNAQPEHKSIQAAEAAGTAAVTAGALGVAAGAAAVGDFAHAGKILATLGKEFMKDPYGFLKKNIIGAVVISGVGFMTAAMVIAMFLFIPIFAIEHFSETAKDAATGIAVTTVNPVVGVVVAGTKLYDAVTGSVGTPRVNLSSARVTTLPDGTIATDNQIIQVQAGEAQQPTAVSRLLEQLDFTKILQNLGQQGLLRVYSNGQEVPIEELGTRTLSNLQLRAGTQTVDIPNDPTTPEFVNEFFLFIRENNLFAQDSRVYLSKELKKVYSDNGVVLNRWEGKGEDITDYGKNIKSAFTAVSNGNDTRLNTSLADVESAGNELTNSANTLLDDNPSASTKGYVERTINEAWSTTQGGDKTTIADFASQSGNSALFVAASYCSAKSFIEPVNYTTLVTQQYKGAIRNGLKVLSAADQIKAGDSTRYTVGAESQRREGYETSRAYLKAINLDVRERRPDLDESQLSMLDPQIVYNAMNAIVVYFEEHGLSAINFFGFSNFINNIRGAMCERLSNIDSTEHAGKIANQIAGNVQVEDILNVVKNSLNAGGATALVEKLGLNKSERTFSEPTEEMVNFMFNSQKALNYAGLDDGVDLASKEYEGMYILGNELARISGGRPLTTQECSLAKSAANQQEIVLRNRKSLAYRLFDPMQAKSPVALGLAHVPVSTGGAVTKTKLALSSSLNPVNTLVASTQKLAYSTTLADNQAFAQSAPQLAEDRQLCYGYSQEEQDKIAGDSSFWPLENAQIVEHGELNLPESIRECYSEPMYTLISDLAANGNTEETMNPYYSDSKCSSEALSSDAALHYRIYLGHLMQLGSLVDMQEITETSTGGGAGGPTPDGAVTEDQTQLTTGCGGIRVHTSIVSNIEALCGAAATSGLNLTGGGWRGPEEQINLRKAHCGSSQYDIYEKPADQCSPPTARPGSSRHERGLAIDFENCSSRSSACHQWLAANAAQFGMYNLPSEPWHWSTDGNERNVRL